MCGIFCHQVYVSQGEREKKKKSVGLREERGQNLEIEGINSQESLLLNKQTNKNL